MAVPFENQRSEPSDLRPVKISIEHISSGVWQRLLDATAFRSEYMRKEFFRKIDDLEKLRTDAEYNTGSIAASSAWLLFSAAFYFRPKRVLEIGTFIGKSALSIALGCDAAGEPCELHTCDNSNSIELPPVTESKIFQYKKQTSTQMLNVISMSGNKRPFDFAHFDGRIQPADLPLLARILDKNSVIALDDYAGVEKGVANIFMLRSSGLYNSHVIIPPCTQSILDRAGLIDKPKTALLVPTSLLEISPQ